MKRAVRTLLAPPINNNSLQESLKKLGAQQKQIDAWTIAINKYHKNKSMLVNKHKRQENYSQNLLQNTDKEDAGKEDTEKENTWEDELEEGSNDLPIPTDNWDAVRLFMLLATQWRINDAKPIGIDYSAIEPTAKLAEIKLSQLIFEKIRFMEQTTLEIYAEVVTDQ